MENKLPKARIYGSRQRMDIKKITGKIWECFSWSFGLLNMTVVWCLILILVFGGIAGSIWNSMLEKRVEIMLHEIGYSQITAEAQISAYLESLGYDKTEYEVLACDPIKYIEVHGCTPKKNPITYCQVILSGESKFKESVILGCDLNGFCTRNYEEKD